MPNEMQDNRMSNFSDGPGQTQGLNVGGIQDLQNRSSSRGGPGSGNMGTMSIDTPPLASPLSGVSPRSPSVPGASPGPSPVMMMATSVNTNPNFNSNLNYDINVNRTSNQGGSISQYNNSPGSRGYGTMAGTNQGSMGGGGMTSPVISDNPSAGSNPRGTQSAAGNQIPPSPSMSNRSNLSSYDGRASGVQMQAKSPERYGSQYGNQGSTSNPGSARNSPNAPHPQSNIELQRMSQMSEGEKRFKTTGGAIPKPRHFGDLVRLLSDKEKFATFIEGHKVEIRGWSAMACFVLIVFVFLSDRTFSFLLTSASIISMCSFLLIAVMIENAQSCEGVSVRMIEMWLIIEAARMFAIIPFEGYLPYDRSGDWFYQVSEAFIFLLVASILYSCKKRFPDTYSSENDAFRHDYLIGISCLVAIFVHPNLNGFIPSDICWAWSLYLEALASLPQLYYFQKERKIQPWTAHFLAAQAGARLCSMIFWIASYAELHDFVHLQGGLSRPDDHPFGIIPGHREIRSVMGYWVLFVQAFQLLLMGDFIIQYSKCVGTGAPVTTLMQDLL